MVALATAEACLVLAGCVGVSIVQGAHSSLDV
jgi:hypothetical protein